MKKRLYWIDYLKLFACLMVMISHFYMAAYQVCDLKPNVSGNPWFIFSELFRLLVNGNFWVMVFCLLSGILISKKHISSFKELLIEIFFRYLRLFIPILITSLIILLIQETIGFHNVQYGTLSENQWLSEFYSNEFDLLHVVFYAATFNPIINRPFWMLRALLLGNILILIINYLSERYASNKRLILALITLATFAFVKTNNNLLCTSAVLIGSLISQSKKVFSKKSVLMAVSIIWLISYLPLLENMIENRTVKVVFNFIDTPYMNCLLAVIMIYFFSKCEGITDLNNH